MSIRQDCGCLTGEAQRILRAALTGRLRTNDVGRWVIVGGGPRPDRKTREALVRADMVAYHSRWAPEGYEGAHITDKGREALGLHVPQINQSEAQ